MPQLKFRNIISKKDIVYYDVESKLNILKEMQGTCYLCKIDKGLVITCDYIGCNKKLHPRCMAKAKLIDEFEKMAVGPLMTKLKNQSIYTTSETNTPPEPD